MSSYWMKQTLIVSVLTVLMILPAAAQQRRPQGPAKPAGGIPGKLEVPPKLGLQFNNAIEAQKAVIQAQIAALQALKVLSQEVAGFKLSTPTSAKSRDRDISGGRGAATGLVPPPTQKRNVQSKKGAAGRDQASYHPVGYGQQQAEEAFFKLVALIQQGGGGGRTSFVTVPEMPREDLVASTSGELHSMKMAGKELDTAIGALNTQLRELTAVSAAISSPFGPR